MDDRGGGRTEVPERGAQDGGGVDAEGEHQDARADALDHLAREGDEIGNLAQAVLQEDDVSRFGADVRGAVAQGEPDVGGGERGRVIDPVPHHEHAEALVAQLADLPGLVLGEEPCVHLRDPRLARDSLRRGLLIPGQDAQARDPQLLQAEDRLRSIRAQRIAERDDAGRSSARGHRHRRLTLLRAAGRRRLEPGRILADRLAHEREVSHPHPRPVDTRLDTLTRADDEVATCRKRESASLGLPNDPAAEQVLRRAFRGRRQLQERVFGETGGGDDGGDARTSRGQRAGLVEGDASDARERFDEAAPLDQHPLARQARERGRDRGRRRQDQSARAGDDQGGDRADGLTGEEVDRPAGDQHDRQEILRELVGGALDRRAPPLRFGDQARDAGDGGIVPDALRARLEHAVAVDAPAVDPVAGGLRRRHRLARDHALVEGRLTRADHAVDRHLLPGAHDHGVAH